MSAGVAVQTKAFHFFCSISGLDLTPDLAAIFILSFLLKKASHFSRVLLCGRRDPRTGLLRSCYLTNMHRNAEKSLCPTVATLLEMIRDGGQGGTWFVFS
jgi:hypothetical protein